MKLALAAAEVAQIFNLLYRQVCNLHGAGKFERFNFFQPLPIANRRYSRLQTCTTSAVEFHSLSLRRRLPLLS